MQMSKLFGRGSIYERLDEQLQPETLQLDDIESLRADRQTPHQRPILRSFLNAKSSTTLPAASRRGPVSDKDWRDKSGWAAASHDEGSASANDRDDDDDIPNSLMVEGPATHDHYHGRSYPPIHNYQTADSESARAAEHGSQVRFKALSTASGRELALWRWANVDNLDRYLQEVYTYYIGKGFYNIVLCRIINLATVAFVVAFSVYLSFCIDYARMGSVHKLQDIHVSMCISKLSPFYSFCLWLFGLLWLLKAMQYTFDFRRLLEMRNFFYHLLDIPDRDIETVAWQQVVQQLRRLRTSNPNIHDLPDRNQDNPILTDRALDAHDIANRIMRKENYFIAMVNKNVLNLAAPFPYLSKMPMITRTLEWNIDLCILRYLFDDNGHLRSVFVRDGYRQELVDGLRRRFIFAGFANVILAPFISVFLEYHRNPSAIGSREYTLMAEWRFREYNELYHIFQKRLRLSIPMAEKYINQFPKEKLTQASRFVGFIAGSLLTVLLVCTIFDPELLTHFEITPDRSILFYIGVLGTIVAVSRGLIPEDHVVFEPELLLREVIAYTHYLPSSWNGLLHSHEVKKEFSRQFNLKIFIFFQEVLSLLTTPFILWYSLPKSSEAVIDFFRDYSVHVEGLGYVCSFAVFDVDRIQGHENTELCSALQNDKMDPKMERSILAFKATNPDWYPRRGYTQV